MRPRRPLRSPIKSPAYSTGACTSTFITGSSKVGLAASMPALKALRAASLKTVSGRLDDSLLDGRNKVTRNRTAEHFVCKLELGTAGQRFQANPAIAELAVAAGLLLVPALHLRLAAD